MNKKLKNIVRAEVIGSMLRPRFLLDAQEQFKNGKITSAQLTLIEDKAVKMSVKIQQNSGVDVVSDGEMRRPVFCHNFVRAADGFKWNIPGNNVIWFNMDGKKVIDPVTVGVVKKISKKHDISVDEFSFMRGITSKPIKITIPSPTMLSYYFVPGISNKIYRNPMNYLHDVTKILKDSVSELERIGVNYLQIDAPDFGMLLDPIQKDWFKAKGFDPNILINEGVELINDILSNFSGLKGLHICRGNDKNRFMARGGYEKIAKIVFRKAKVDRLLLEFDSDRAGNFEPLKKVPDDKFVVLGLITTKSPRLEDNNEIIEKIQEANKFISLDRLALSTQCGFASVARGNNLSFNDQTNKLKLVASISHKIWKNI